MGIYNLRSKLRGRRGRELELEVVGAGHMVVFPRKVYQGSGYIFLAGGVYVCVSVCVCLFVCIIHFGAGHHQSPGVMRLSLSLLFHSHIAPFFSFRYFHLFLSPS